jgi:serine/threonine protein kinase
VPGYEIIAELGRGGMGVVYQARHTSLKRLVALKMILSGHYASREQLDRFQREAEALARLQHPNIIRIYEVGEVQGSPFFSLEFVEGGSLARHLDGTPQPPRPAAELVATLARAMHAAHQSGVVHRDLKPANILLGLKSPASAASAPRESFGATLESFEPKISDFGLAKQLDSEADHTLRRRPGHALVHGPRAGRGTDQRCRPGCRRLRSGGDPLRATDRSAAVQGCHLPGHARAGLHM